MFDALSCWIDLMTRSIRAVRSEESTSGRAVGGYLNCINSLGSKGLLVVRQRSRIAPAWRIFFTQQHPSGEPTDSLTS
jgi:hypothetical protein